MRSLLAAIGLARPQPSTRTNVITREEFLRSAADAAARRFDAIDVKRAGVISRSEIRHWLQTQQDRPNGSNFP
jgi:hypothetical protein